VVIEGVPVPKTPVLRIDLKGGCDDEVLQGFRPGPDVAGLLPFLRHIARPITPHDIAILEDRFRQPEPKLIAWPLRYFDHQHGATVWSVQVIGFVLRGNSKHCVLLLVK
jgi:hypothetical protein